MERDVPRTGPGPVAAVHRILIGTALAGALVYAAWELREYGRTGATESLAVAGLALVVAIGMTLYFRNLRGLRAKLTPAADRRDGRA